MNQFNRRIFITTGVAAATASALPPRFTFAAETATQPRLLLPTPAQVAWQDAEVGIIYDFDLAIAAGDTTENHEARKTWDPNLHQPESVFYHSAECGEHRWIGNEAGFAGNPCWATMPEQSQAVLLACSAAGRKFLNTGDPDGSRNSARRSSAASAGRLPKPKAKARRWSFSRPPRHCSMR
jgi:hypothetical protein